MIKEEEERRLIFTWFLKMILLSGLSFLEWIQVSPGKRMVSLPSRMRISDKQISVERRLVTRMAPGLPKLVGTVKLAVNSRYLGSFRVFGSPSTGVSKLFLPEPVSVKKIKQEATQICISNQNM